MFAQKGVEFDAEQIAKRFTVTVRQNGTGTFSAVLRGTRRSKPVREGFGAEKQAAIADALRALDERVRPFVRVVFDPGSTG